MQEPREWNYFFTFSPVDKPWHTVQEFTKCNTDKQYTFKINLRAPKPWPHCTATAILLRDRGHLSWSSAPTPATLASSWSKGKAAHGASQRLLRGAVRVWWRKNSKGRWRMAVPQQCCCHPCHCPATPMGNCPCHGLPTPCCASSTTGEVQCSQACLFLKQCWCLKLQPLKPVAKFIVSTQVSLQDGE